MLLPGIPCWSAAGRLSVGPAPRAAVDPAIRLTALQLPPPFKLLKMLVKLSAYSVLALCGSITTPVIQHDRKSRVGGNPRLAPRQLAPPSVLFHTPLRDFVT